MGSSTTRNSYYFSICSELACMSNSQILSMLDNTDLEHINSWGGSSKVLVINGSKVFVKKIPLTSLENSQKNILSTRNLFNLPLFYQYGIGSSGFGAWRELAAHVLTSNWVLSNQTQNFPLLYGWRVIKGKPEQQQSPEIINQELLDWDNNPTIRHRLESINSSKSYLLLFLEYFSFNLHDWIQKKIANNNGAFLSNLNTQLIEGTDFMRSKKFLHMDAHFKNILTDGETIYFSDFGLAITKKFNLSPSEHLFFDAHKFYDSYSRMLNFSHSVVTSIKNPTYWNNYLKQSASSISIAFETLNPDIINLLQSYLPVAKIMNQFYMDIRRNKNTEFPSAELSGVLGVKAIGR